MTGAGPARPPYESYAGITGTFLGGIGLSSFLADRLGRPRPVQTPLDAVVMALATFKAARTLARDEVLSFAREPFVEGTPTDPRDEHPVRTGGTRQALGELVTCSRCVGTWAAAGLASVDLLAPRSGRLFIWSLAIGGANDWLQAGFAALTGAANRFES